MKMPSETEFVLLQILPAREIGGRDLAKKYEEQTGKVISYGTLYTTMRRLKDAGWVEAREEENLDRRVRLFKLSANGREALPKVIGLKNLFSGEAAWS